MSAPCVAPCATPRSRPSGRETAPGTCAAGRSVQTATRSNRSGPATPARPCAAGRPPCVATRSCCACSTRRRLAKGVFPAAPLPPGRKARPSTHAGPPSSARRPPSACSGRCRAATSANPHGNGNPPPLRAAVPRALAPRPFLLRAGIRLFVQRPPVARLARRRRHGGRPEPVLPLGRRQGCPKILGAHRHALDDSRCRAVLPVSRARCPT